MSSHGTLHMRPFPSKSNRRRVLKSKCQTPANAVLARQQRIEKQKKRKAGDSVDVTQTTVDSAQAPTSTAGPSTNGNGAQSSTTQPSSSSTANAKPAVPQAAPKKTAVWVSNLPPNANIETIASVFSKAGVLMIGDDGGPRVKLYYDDEGNFKGEALVMYFKEGSVTLAVTLLDDTELEMGGGYGNMKVKEADYEARATQKTNEDKAAKKQEGEKTEKKRLTAEEKQRMTKRIKRMQEYVLLRLDSGVSTTDMRSSKVTWHSDDEDDDPLAPAGGAPRPGQNRYNRVVVLKGMFTLADLNKDPALLLELKEDVREECETLGQVTSCTLYDVSLVHPITKTAGRGRGADPGV